MQCYANAILQNLSGIGHSTVPDLNSVPTDLLDREIEDLGKCLEYTLISNVFKNLYSVRFGRNKLCLCYLKIKNER